MLVRTGAGPRDEPITTELEHGNSEMLAMAKDGPYGIGQDCVHARRRRADSTELHEDVHILPVPIAIGIAQRTQPCGAPLGARDELEGRPLVHPPVQGSSRPRLARTALGRGEEPLQIPHPVTTIAARVDPVIAKPAGVAPRTDRVGMDAQKPSSLCH